ncbi:MAG: serine/threonine protein kinase [Candidatus Obscuribacter sp.]|nr:serine/threonine protein kinase [Candidatus Obscuribacter sp.]
MNSNSHSGGANSGRDNSFRESAGEAASGAAYSAMDETSLSGRYAREESEGSRDGLLNFKTYGGSAKKYKVGDLVDGTYELTALLGTGGMGIVFACRHKVLNKDYALKLIHRADIDGLVLSRFKAEAVALARLNHPGIVGIHNMGLDQDGNVYYVMDLLSGETLDARLRRSGPMDMQTAVALFMQVADALGSAHAHNIVHRDVKPSNLMLVYQEAGAPLVKLVDFGIARLSGIPVQTQTATGTVFGTPFYMSPEQCDGRKIDQRSDIYSLGCTLFEALTGKPPFRGGNPFQTFYMHQTIAPPPLSSAYPDGKFSAALEACLEKMLAKQPNERYQDMNQLKHDFERILAGKEIFAPQTGSRVTTELKKPSGSFTFGLPTMEFPVNAAGFAAPTSDLPAGQQIAEGGTARYGERKLTAAETCFEEVPARDNAGLLAVVLKVAVLMVLVLGAAAALTYTYFKRPSVPEKVLDKQTRRDLVEINAAVGARDGAKPYTMNGVLRSQRQAVDGGLDQAGATETEYNAVDTYFLFRYKPQEQAYRFALQKFIDKKIQPYYVKSAGVFKFPEEFILGEISVVGRKPVHALGEVSAPPGSDVVFYLNAGTREYPQILDGFRSYDLTGLEMQTEEPQRILSKVRNWKRLKHLSFFNSLTKVLPKYERYDESPISDRFLMEIDRLSSLNSLGLCGPNVTGKAILHMSLLKKLQCLQLKRIAGAEPLLASLEKYPNLKEIWLVAMGTTDNDLEYLVKMKNLETLRIRRGHITPASLGYFKRMSKLKRLYIDKHWSDADLAAFKKALPFCQFESIYDVSYMELLPKQETSRIPEDY